MRSLLRSGTAALAVLLLAGCAAPAPEPAAPTTTEPAPTASPSEPAPPSPTASPEAEPACTETAPDASTIENLQAVVNNANTEPLLAWVAPTVNVALAASSAYGPQTPNEAVLDLVEFLLIDPSMPPAQYDFALPAATLDAYRAGDYADYFPPTALVGRGTDNRVVAYSFDCNGLVDTMLLVSDESLLL